MTRETEPNISVIAECSAGRVQPVTYETVDFAGRIARPGEAKVSIAVIGDPVEPLARELASRTSRQVHAVASPGASTYNGEVWLALLRHLYEQYPADLILVPHTSTGWDFAPALAVKLEASCLSAIHDFERDPALVFTRQICGGKILEHLQALPDRPAVITVMPGATVPLAPQPIAPGPSHSGSVPAAPSAGGFERSQAAQPSACKSPSSSEEQPGSILVLRMAPPATRARTLSQTEVPPNSVNLRDAETIVAAGRGIGSPEHLDRVRELASLFKRGAVGASRPLCDQGWLALGHQVGMTGQTVSPRLYIACGISGMVQHVMGIKSPELIVSINRDRNAPFSRLAHYSVVADLREFLPVLIERIRNFRDRTPSDRTAQIPDGPKKDRLAY